MFLYIEGAVASRLLDLIFRVRMGGVKLGKDFVSLFADGSTLFFGVVALGTDETAVAGIAAPQPCM
jgi:hypothetical protein